MKTYSFSRYYKKVIPLLMVILYAVQARAQNDVMMQAFYWNVPVDEVNKNGTWWDNLKGKAAEFKSAGITGIWVPAPSKGNWGITDMGYGIYDHYDLGNYLQKGSTETRFGSRQELQDMISEMHISPKVEVYADIILNHVYSSDENEEVNPAVKAYEFGEAHGGANTAYPTNEIKWMIPNAQPGDYYIQIKGFNLNWLAGVEERAYDVNINWTGAATVEAGDWEFEPNNGGGQFNVFPASGRTVRAHSDYTGDIDEYKITVTTAADLVIRLTSRKETQSPYQWLWADQVNGYYPVAVWYNGTNLATNTLEARTNTNITYINHTGTGEANYTWNYSHFHPSDANDWLGGPGGDEIITNTKFFGNDFNTFNTTVQTRLKNWGYWLANQVNFDGFRLDFVRGFQEAFVSDWINNLPKLNSKQRFIVGEYWGSGYRIKNWVNTLSGNGAIAHGFDFPLKPTLTDMCNNNAAGFNMAWLNNAGMIRTTDGNSLPDSSIVTFADNHDTGKEHDKWITKDFKLAYAYILTHQGRPCIFYPHYYGVTQKDASDSTRTVTAPGALKTDINNLIGIRKTYLGGSLAVLSQSGNPYPSGDTYNVYIARRQGNGTKGGAIVVLNNHDNDVKGLWVDTSPTGYENLAGQVLVNALNGRDTVTVQMDGRAYFSAPARGFAVWVKGTDYDGPLPFARSKALSETTISIYPNPVSENATIRMDLKKQSAVLVTIIDMSGREVATLYKGMKPAGKSTFTWQCSTAPAGTYICLVKTPQATWQQKIQVSK
jgi:alpha-amylase